MGITSVEKNKKNKGRMSIYIDGRYSLTISEDDYLSMHLYDRFEISDEEIDYIKNTLNFQASKSKAVNYLSYKMRTEKEVRLKLLDEGFDSDCIDNTIEELKAIGYINNKLYAQKYVYDRSKLKPKSKKLLRLELMSRGISQEIADEVLDDWDIDESDVALSLAKKKFGKYELNDETTIRKIYMFLNHRVYNSEIIKEVIDKLSTQAYYHD
jgi:regulatory protein